VGLCRNSNRTNRQGSPFSFLQIQIVCRFSLLPAFGCPSPFSGLTTAALFSGYFSAYKSMAMRVSFFLKAFCSCLLLGLFYSCSAQSKTAGLAQDSSVTPAAARPEQYLPLLKGKNVAVFANQTSVVGKRAPGGCVEKSGGEH
jgi:hypothetical protein